MYRLETKQGFQLGEFESYEDANALLERYVALDKSVGIVEKDYYRVVDV